MPSNPYLGFYLKDMRSQNRVTHINQFSTPLFVTAKDQMSINRTLVEKKTDKVIKCGTDY